MSEIDSNVFCQCLIWLKNAYSRNIPWKAEDSHLVRFSSVVCNVNSTHQRHVTVYKIWTSHTTCGAIILLLFHIHHGIRVAEGDKNLVLNKGICLHTITARAVVVLFYSRSFTCFQLHREIIPIQLRCSNSENLLL